MISKSLTYGHNIHHGIRLQYVMCVKVHLYIICDGVLETFAYITYYYF